jgi:hypothetical protein
LKEAKALLDKLADAAIDRLEEIVRERAALKEKAG